MEQVGITNEGCPVISGVFKMVGTHGIPLEVVLEYLNGKNLSVCWITYIKDAMKDGAKLSGVITKIEVAVGEVYGPSYCKMVSKKLKELYNG